MMIPVLQIADVDCGKDTVGLTCGDFEGAVVGQKDCGQDFLGVTVADGHQAGAQGHRVTEADEVGEDDSVAFRSVVVCPVVQPSGGWDGGGELRHRQGDRDDHDGGREPRPEEACWSGREA
ncbi:hypothetical protein PMKS-002645 [Pichia membranifaciens]|uniref:Uncharacterized protein n=1 Tax=Pichia membranifaciens TaxID=4926 RepID=A0A1Q2YI22_9ASCO|nr:hypothetical protein PMKS-002645 [Pichia membranifaciens]